jgi:hypothetical protein
MGVDHVVALIPRVGEQRAHRLERQAVARAGTRALGELRDAERRALAAILRALATAPRGRNA